MAVKAFINLTGMYPVGSRWCSTRSPSRQFVAVNPDPTAMSRPLVRRITDDQGNHPLDPRVYDLTACDASGQFEYTVIRTEPPQRDGITISDYFA